MKYNLNKFTTGINLLKTQREKHTHTQTERNKEMCSHLFSFVLPLLFHHYQIFFLITINKNVITEERGFAMFDSAADSIFFCIFFSFSGYFVRFLTFGSLFSGYKLIAFIPSTQFSSNIQFVSFFLYSTTNRRTLHSTL